MELKITGHNTGIDVQPNDILAGLWLDLSKEPEPVYGIKGIQDLFRVSRSTAQRYANTFLKPAISRNGRKIMVDADKAVELWEVFYYDIKMPL